MSKISLLMTIAATAAVASAQTTSTTIPSGYDTTRGDAAVFAGFDVKFSATSTTLYNPSRAIYSYDADLIPTNLVNRPISKISMRRDATFVSTDTFAHKKEVYLRMSSRTTKAADFGDISGWDANHGTNVIDVFGTATNPKMVDFPQTAAPAAGKVAAWNVVIPLDRPFLLRAKETFVLEYRTYKVDTPHTGVKRWRTDGKIYPSTGYGSGSLTNLTTVHCTEKPIFWEKRVWRPGSSALMIWRSQVAKANMIGVAWIGAPLTNPIPVPGTGDATKQIAQCQLIISPDLIALPRLSSDAGVFNMDWGLIPNDPTLLGTKLPQQACYFEPSLNAAGVGFTRAIQHTIAPAYDPAVTKVGALYSYGNNTTKYNSKPVDPNTEPMPRYHYRRAPILNIN